MPGFRELSNGFQKTINKDGTKLTRVFIEDPNGNDDLISLGGEDPDVPTAFAIQQVVTKYGDDARTEKIVVSLETGEASQNEDVDVDPQDLPQSFELGGQFLSVNEQRSLTGAGWTWRSDAAAVDQQLQKRIINGTYRVTKVHRAVRFGVLKEKFGKINSDAFPPEDPIAAGHWLYIGVRLQRTFDASGNRQWIGEHTFALDYKTNNDQAAVGGLPAEPFGWNFVWRPDKSRYDEPRDINNNPIYESTNFLRAAGQQRII